MIKGLPSFTECISDEEDEDVDGFRGSPDLREAIASSGGSSNRVEAAAAVERKPNKLEKQEVPAKPSKTVVWKESSLEPEELEAMFPRKELQPAAATKAAGTSLLARLLQDPSADDANPWLEFGRFDATGNPEAKTVRQILIYYPMSADDGEQTAAAATAAATSGPIHVSCGRDATVRDLVGLACCVYTQARRQPRLNPPVDNYSLFMCEEDGTVDVDFPALDPHDPLSKYGFEVLALVERPYQETRVSCVILHMPDGTFSQIEVQRKDMALGELMDKGLERRKFLNRKHNFGYHMEAPDSPGNSSENTRTDRLTSKLLKIAQLREYFVTLTPIKRTILTL